VIRISRKIRDQIVPTKWTTIGRHFSADDCCSWDANPALTDSDDDTDGDGVSDPSGHARDDFQRADWGRSRHRLLPLLRHRRRQRAAKSAARFRDGLRAARRSLSARREYQPRKWVALSTLAGGQRDAGLNDRGTTSFPAVVPEVVLSCKLIRRRQPRKRDEDTDARARHTQRGHDRDRARRQARSNQPSIGCWWGLRATADTEL
jgi:hypothetical protein